MKLLLSIIRMSYYAVKTGRNPGIYSSWDECRSQVNGFSKARYKKFATEEAAMAFVNDSEGQTDIQPQPCYQHSRPSHYVAKRTTYEPYGGSSSSSTVSVQYTEPHIYSTSKETTSTETTSKETTSTRKKRKIVDTDFETSAEVYTDGCCHDNGRGNPNAGIGVYWGDDSPWNVSERLSGRQTNNRAEIHAARKAIEQAKQRGIHNLNVMTDSEFLINGVTKWMHKWKRNGWILYDGKPVKNKEDFEQLDKSLQGISVTWTHVRGHVGIPGNEAADRLANEGAGKRS